MSRDFAYKKHGGRGAVPVRKKIIVWSSQLIILALAFIVVFVIFISLSSSRNQRQQTSDKPVEQPINTTNEQLQFYDVLQQPLENETRRTQSVSTDYYRIRSSIIEDRVHARSLKALLVFQGFNHVQVEKQQNSPAGFRLIVDRISSRSKMNQVRDFLGKYDLDSNFIKINAQ